MSTSDIYSFYEILNRQENIDDFSIQQYLNILKDDDVHFLSKYDLHWHVQRYTVFNKLKTSQINDPFLNRLSITFDLVYHTPNTSPAFDLLLEDKPLGYELIFSIYIMLKYPELRPHYLDKLKNHDDYHAIQTYLLLHQKEYGFFSEDAYDFIQESFTELKAQSSQLKSLSHLNIIQ